MSDCAAPRHSGQAEPTPTEATAVLCRPCRAGLARDLARLPGLHHDLTHLTPTRALGDGDGLPYNDTAAEARSQILHDLAWWALTASKDRREVRPPYELAVLAAYLHRLASPPRPWIPYQPWAPDMAGAIGDDRNRALALLDPWIRKVFPVRGPDGACLNCVEGQLEVTVYASEGDRRRSFVACGACGHRWEPEQWMRLGKDIIRRRDQAVGALARDSRAGLAA